MIYMWSLLLSRQLFLPLCSDTLHTYISQFLILIFILYACPYHVFKFQISYLNLLIGFS